MDIEEFLTQFSIAVFRRSKLILDNCGIYIDEGELPSAEKERAAYRRAYGHSRFTKLLCKVRRKFFKSKQSRLEDECNLATIAVRREFWVEAIRRANEYLQSALNN